MWGAIRSKYSWRFQQSPGHDSSSLEFDRNEGSWLYGRWHIPGVMVLLPICTLYVEKSSGGRGVLSGWKIYLPSHSFIYHPQHPILIISLLLCRETHLNFKTVQFAHTSTTMALSDCVKMWVAGCNKQVLICLKFNVWRAIAPGKWGRAHRNRCGVVQGKEMHSHGKKG